MRRRLPELMASLDSLTSWGACRLVRWDGWLVALDQIVLPESEDDVHLAGVGDVFAIGDFGPKGVDGFMRAGDEE